MTSFITIIWGFISKLTAKDILYIAIIIGVIFLGLALNRCEHEKMQAKIEAKEAVIDLKNQTISVVKNSKGQKVYHSGTIAIDKDALHDAIASSPAIQSIISDNKIKAQKIDALTYEISDLKLISSAREAIRWKDTTINDTAHIKVGRITDPDIIPYIDLSIEQIGDNINYNIEVKDTLSNIIHWHRKKVATWLFGGVGLGSKKYSLESIHSNPFIRNTIQKSLIVKKN